MSIERVLDLLRCPLCGGELTLVDRAVRCPARHSFDLARQGYLNLLGRAAPAHADTPGMVAARARFLDSGAYDPLSQALRRAVPESAGEQRRARNVVEVGAGTGHYLARLLTDLGARGVALDISLAACRRAAQAHPDSGAVVADVWRRLPLASGAYDVVLSIFAPRNAAEFARVLQAGGVLVIATPLPDHLNELRGRLGLMEIQPGKDQRLAASLTAGFRRTTREECRYRLQLTADSAGDLVGMGPNAFHRSQESFANQLGGLSWPQSVTVAVAVSGWALR